MTYQQPLTTPPIHFILPQQPGPRDKRPRNGFGVLKSFGKAAAELTRLQEAAADAAAQQLGQQTLVAFVNPSGVRVTRDTAAETLFQPCSFQIGIVGASVRKFGHIQNCVSHRAAVRQARELQAELDARV